MSYGVRYDPGFTRPSVSVPVTVSHDPPAEPHMTLSLKLPHWAAIACAVVACAALGAEGAFPAYAPLLKGAVFLFGSLSGGIFAVTPAVVTRTP